LGTDKTDWMPLSSDGRTSALHPDGDLLAVGLKSSVIQFFSVEPFHEDGSIRAHSLADPKKTEVLALAFSPDGRTLASGGQDGTVRLWHVKTRQELLRFDSIPAQVNQLAFSPDGTTLAAALHNGEIWLWRADETSRRTLSGRGSR